MQGENGDFDFQCGSTRQPQALQHLQVLFDSQTMFHFFRGGSGTLDGDYELWIRETKGVAMFGPFRVWKSLFSTTPTCPSLSAVSPSSQYSMPVEIYSKGSVINDSYMLERYGSLSHSQQLLSRSTGIIRTFGYYDQLATLSTSVPTPLPSRLLADMAQQAAAHIAECHWETTIQKYNLTHA